MDFKIYKKVGNEVWVIPCGEPSKHHFKEPEKLVIPHQDEKTDFEGLKHYQQLKERWKI